MSRYDMNQRVYVPKHQTSGYPYSDGRTLRYFMDNGNGDTSTVLDESTDTYHIVITDWLVPDNRCPHCGQETQKK